MTAKTANKPNKPAPVKAAHKETEAEALKRERDELQALLNATRAENELLRTRAEQASKQASKADPKRAAWEAVPSAEDFVAAAGMLGTTNEQRDTILDSLSKMSRDELLDAASKAMRAVKHSEIPAVLAELVTRALTGETIHGAGALVTKVLTKRGYNKKNASEAGAAAPNA